MSGVTMFMEASEIVTDKHSMSYILRCRKKRDLKEVIDTDIADPIAETYYIVQFNKYFFPHPKGTKYLGITLVMGICPDCKKLYITQRETVQLGQYSNIIRTDSL